MPQESEYDLNMWHVIKRKVLQNMVKINCHSSKAVVALHVSWKSREICMTKYMQQQLIDFSFKHYTLVSNVADSDFVNDSDVSNDRSGTCGPETSYDVIKLSQHWFR